ncbi:MAG: DUF4351 domain-containing protein, partial [Armatimonadota bacterium]|nr:DUF4351 domain-containing protein [Armatimonadota bacterium]
EDVEEIVMTDAQWLMDEGWKKGQQEGQQEGAAREARRILLRLGSRQYGPPDEKVQSAIESMTSVEQMEELMERLRDVNDWNALLAN